MNINTDYIIEITRPSKGEAIADIDYFELNNDNYQYKMSEYHLSVYSSKPVYYYINECDKYIYETVCHKSKLIIIKEKRETYLVSNEIYEMLISYETFKKTVYSKKNLSNIDYLSMFEELKIITNISNGNFTELKSKLDSIITAYKL